jgi:sorting nexin-25
MVRISRATESIRDHKRVTYYEILIDKENGLRKWAVRRRYNDFLLLHRKLKENYPIVHEFDLPGKNFSMFHSKIEREDLKQERMHALEKYLQRLIDNPLICQSEDLRTFLSSAEYKERRLYNTVKSIMHSDEGSHYNLKSGAQKFVQLVGNAKKKLLIGKEDVLVSEKSLNVQKTPDISADDETSEDPDGDWGLSNEEQTDEESSSSQGSLSGPLCSVLVELFDFKEQDYYLKKTSSAMLMKQYFGGRMSLESEIAGILANYMTEDVVCKILSRASFDRLFGAEPIKRNVFKSDDNLKSSQENVTRNEMKSKLFSVWPESFTRFLGPDATQTGVSRMLDLIQSSILNRHLIFTILDSIVETILEE